jgi:NAD(P)-dependent dehydrogenase (short-subunit alcohol dehydrogenase family)
MDLKGAVAVVTGGNGGLGQRICHALAKEGAHIAVIYAQSRDEAEGVARELTSRHQINAAAFACDVTDDAAVQRLIGDVTTRFGRLVAPEILVNCVAPGLLEGTRATSNLRPEQVERSASGSLLKKAADKDDCADMVVAMCRTETMTGQTVVIDSGRLFH